MSTRIGRPGNTDSSFQATIWPTDSQGWYGSPRPLDSPITSRRNAEDGPTRRPGSWLGSGGVGPGGSGTGSPIAPFGPPGLGRNTSSGRRGVRRCQALQAAAPDVEGQQAQQDRDAQRQQPDLPPSPARLVGPTPLPHRQHADDQADRDGHRDGVADQQGIQVEERRAPRNSCGNRLQARSR